MSALDPKATNSQLERAGASDESIHRVHTALLTRSPDLQEGRSKLPLILLGFVSVMIFIAAIYVVRNRGGFDPLAQDARYDPRLAVTGQKAAVDPIAEGKKQFTTCVACHQATGLGVPGAFPPLAGSEGVNGSEERVIRIVLSGLSGPVKVAGATFNGAMPAFGPGGFGWGDDKIAFVLSFVRQSWGNTGPAITPEKVTEIRTKVGQRKPWTEAELQAVP